MHSFGLISHLHQSVCHFVLSCMKEDEMSPVAINNSVLSVSRAARCAPRHSRWVTLSADASPWTPENVTWFGQTRRPPRGYSTCHNVSAGCDAATSSSCCRQGTRWPSARRDFNLAFSQNRKGRRGSRFGLMADDAAYSNEFNILSMSPSLSYLTDTSFYF